MIFKDKKKEWYGFMHVRQSLKFFERKTFKYHRKESSFIEFLKVF